MPAMTVSSFFTSARLPPCGPLAVRMRTASRMVSVGFIFIQRSTRLSSSFWCICLRDPPITPIQFCPERGGGRRNAALDVAPPRVVHRAVEDLHLLRPCFKTEFHHGGDDLGVRVSRLLGQPVPADVRLNDDDITAGNKSSDPAQGVNSGLRDLRG